MVGQVGQLGAHGDGDGGAGGGLGDGGRQATVDEDWWGDAAGELAQLVEGLLGLFHGALDDGRRGRRVLLGLPVGTGQVHAQAHEALLGAVVDVALQATAGVGLGALDGGPGGLEAADLAAPGEHGAAEPDLHGGQAPQDGGGGQGEDDAAGEVESDVPEQLRLQAQKMSQPLALPHGRIEDQVKNDVSDGGEETCHGQGQPHNTDDPGDEGDREVDDGPQQIHPALGVAQAPEEPTMQRGSRLGLEVAAGYRLAPVHARHGEAGDVGEAPGDAQVDDEHQQPHPDDGGDHAEGGQRHKQVEGEQAQWPAEEEEGGVPAELAVARGPC